ncbi:F-box/kelch-repeat protein At1g15670 [Linum grandiflorum]
MTKLKHSSSELIPRLPDDIAMECLIRLHFTSHAVASQVCSRWRHLVRSRDFYHHRRNTGHTRKVACLIHALSTPERNNNPAGHTSALIYHVSALTRYGITMFDPVTGSWKRIESVPEYPSGLPLFCKLVSSEGKLVVIGGWDPVDYHPVRHVFVYDFTTLKWRSGKAMPGLRSFFAAAATHGGEKVFVAGGHDESKNALRSAWVYDVRADEWEELPPMSQERDECEAVAIGSEVWVVGGYRTDMQGKFESGAEAIDIGELKWRPVEDVWKDGRCPKSCIGVRTTSNGEEKAAAVAAELFDWAEMGGGEVKVGACAVQLGSGMTLVSGSAYQGGPQRAYVVEGQDGKWNKLSIPPEFAGFIQSGCCAEV